MGEAGMNSWETIKLFGSAVLPRTIHLYQLATACAMLTCAAVALNMGPFAKAPKTDVVERARRDAARAVSASNEFILSSDAGMEGCRAER